MTDRMTTLYKKMAESRGESTDALITEATKKIPMQRLGQPEEMADLIAFLTSERASFITGQSISLDGGALASTL